MSEERLRPPEGGRGKKGFSPRAIRERMALLGPLFWTSGLRNHERLNFCCFMPPSLWKFVTAVLGNGHKGQRLSLPGK